MTRLLWILCFLPNLLFSQSEEASHWTRPRFVQGQFAGGIGLANLGVGWELKKKPITFELGMGHVPAGENGRALWIASTKALYTFKWSKNFGEKITWTPLRAGMYGSFHFGDRMNRYRDRSKYTPNYYWWSVPIRYAFLLQTAVRFDWKDNQALEYYFEANANDLYIASYFVNQNYLVLSPFSIFTLGMGMRYKF